jgi:hypothetical protein
MGALTNIDEEGFASAAFHSYPDMMKFDPYSGDYGPNFFGHTWAAATYLVRDAEFGWLGFGGNVTVRGDEVRVEPKDSMRQRLFVAPLALWVTLDAGRIAAATYDTSTGAVELTLDAADAWTPRALVNLQQTAKVDGLGTITPEINLVKERGAYIVPLGKQSVTVRLAPAKERK